LSVGFHNSNLSAARDRLTRGQTYKDLSTICVVPTRGMIHAKVVQSWMGLMPPMNQKFIRMFMIGMEVGHAYNAAVEQILASPDLSKWKYMLTLEEDNIPPPDGLLRLYESIENYDAVGGLYWTKGESGQPMIYGDPKQMPKNFIPQLPRPGEVQQCNGLGMGFTLFRIAMFKKVPKPWFKTEQSFTPGVGVRAYTQDLFFFELAGAAGFKFACDTRVLVGHFDAENDRCW
jgi:hypothetical protein